MYDTLTAQALAANNQLYNSELKARLDVMLSQERVLDKAPDKYVPVCRGMEFEPFGVYSMFRRVFTDYDTKRHGAEFFLNIDNQKVSCERKVYVLLRTLMDVGVSRSAARALACRELFTEIVGRRTEDGITLMESVKALSMGDNYYKNEIIRAALDCLFTEKEQVEIRLKDMVGGEYSSALIEALGDPGDVDELEDAIKKAYKVVCMNQEFRVKKNLGRAVNVARYIKEGFKL